MFADEKSGMRTQLLRLLILAAAFLLAARFVTPGFLMLDVPVHSDVWRYFSYAQADITWSEIRAPRPLMLLYLKLIGITPNFGLFVAALLLPAVLLPYFMLRSFERVTGVGANQWSAACYFLVCFSLPSFYELQTFDIGGVLAGLIGCLYLERLASIDQTLKAPREWLQATIVPAILAWLSMEAKPTFGAILPFLPLLFIRRAGWKITVARCGLIAAVVFGVLLKERLLGSAFVGSGQVQGSSYALADNPAIVVETFGYYVARLLPALAYILVGLSYAKLIRRGRWRWTVVIPALALLAIVPVLAIPNHRFEMYAWYGASILVLPLALLFEPGRRGLENSLWRLSSAVAVIVALFAIVQASPQLRTWYESSQRANANTLHALDTLRARLVPGERLLVVGLLNAYSPFRNDDFIQSRFPYRFEWNVVVPPRDQAWIESNKDSTRAIRTGDVKLEKFDRIAVFSSEGYLTNLTRPEVLASVPAQFRVAALACGYREGMLVHSVLLGCLRESGEHQTVLYLASTDASKDQWEYFSIGQAHEALGDRARAHEAYAAADVLEPAPIFSDAMKRTLPIPD